MLSKAGWVFLWRHDLLFFCPWHGTVHCNISEPERLTIIKGILHNKQQVKDHAIFLYMPHFLKSFHHFWRCIARTHKQSVQYLHYNKIIWSTTQKIKNIKNKILFWKWSSNPLIILVAMHWNSFCKLFGRNTEITKMLATIFILLV